MHGDYPSFIPKELREKSREESVDNVLEFESHDKPAEHVVEHIRKEAGAHEAPVLLNQEGLALAEAEVTKLQDLQKKILADFNNNHKILGFGKKRVREINKSLSIKNLPEISENLRKLESNIAFTKARPEPMSKAEFNKLKPYQKSMAILKEAGYSSIAEARAAHLKLGESQDSILARMIRTATITAAKEGTEGSSNVVQVPESVWPGPEPKDDPEEEFRKAA